MLEINNWIINNPHVGYKGLSFFLMIFNWAVAATSHSFVIFKIFFAKNTQFLAVWAKEDLLQKEEKNPLKTIPKLLWAFHIIWKVSEKWQDWPIVFCLTPTSLPSRVRVKKMNVALAGWWAEGGECGEARDLLRLHSCWWASVQAPRPRMVLYVQEVVTLPKILNLI